MGTGYTCINIHKHTCIFANIYYHKNKYIYTHTYITHLHIYICCQYILPRVVDCVTKTYNNIFDMLLYLLITN